MIRFALNLTELEQTPLQPGRTGTGHWARSSVLLGIDHFGQINRTLGRRHGDQVLKTITQRIGALANATTLRWHGDQCLLIRSETRLGDAWVWAERLRRAFEQSVIHTSYGVIPFTVSLGVTLVPEGPLTESTIAEAEQSLQLAKHHGRNRVCTWPMVQIDRILMRTAAEPETSLEQRRLIFLQRCQMVLGPTQLEYVTSHAVQVSQTAVRLAMLLQMDELQITRVQDAALLHDIGKCVIPEELLAKPGPLSIEQAQFIATHASVGAWIASRLGADEQVVAMVRDHHRRYDCDLDHPHPSHSVPLGARVLCVADALMAMTTNRRYQPARTVHEAMTELRRQRGAQFDPRVVDAAEQLDLSRVNRAA